MSDDPDAVLAATRSALQRWMGGAGYASTSDEALADGVSAELYERYAYELSTSWNPSACSFDAYWTLGGRVPDGLEKPFSAEQREGARMLACVGLIRALAIERAAAVLRRPAASGSNGGNR
jgi:hypothetical protein